MTLSTTIPQGLRLVKHGRSATDADLADAWNAYLTPSSIGTNSLANLGSKAVAINGRQFNISTEFEPYRRESFRHRTVDALREGISYDNIPGEGTVNTEGLWRRGQDDWSLGAGQQYLDRKSDSLNNRFYKSKGIDFFQQQFQATLQYDTTVKYNNNGGSVAPNIMTARCGTTTFIVDGTTVKKTSNWSSYTTMNFTASGTYTTPTNIYSITSNDAAVYLGTDTGIWVALSTASAFTGYVELDLNSVVNGAPYTMVSWTGDFLLAGALNYLYLFKRAASNNPPDSNSATTTGVGLERFFAHINPNWVWSAACAGASQVYVAGYVKTSTPFGGKVYRIGISLTTVGAIQYDTPVQALPMSPDEYPTALFCYLNYIFVGSNRGIRMCDTLVVYDPTTNSNTADLKAGPLIPNLLEPVTLPVTAIVADGRFVWFAWNNYDAISTGVGKLDLSTFVDSLQPAYQSDLMVTGQGQINSLDWDPNTQNLVLSVASLGCYRPATTYVDSGSLYTGAYNYGLSEHKTPVFFDYGVLFPVTPAAATPANSIATIQVEPFSSTLIHSFTLTPASVSGDTEVFITNTAAYSGENFQLVLTLDSDSTHATTPVLYRWTMKSWPMVANETQITPVLNLFQVEDDGQGLESFTDPYEAFMWLENLRFNQQIITYQEGSLTASVVIQKLDFLPERPIGEYVGGFDGVCVVYLQTIGGYNPYTGPPTN